MSAPAAPPPADPQAPTTASIGPRPAFAAHFGPADPAAWRAAVEGVLKGQPFDKRMRVSVAEGVVAPALSGPEAVGPEAFATSRLCRKGPWERRAEHGLAAPADDAALAEALRDEAARGATSIWLRDPGAQGWSAARLLPLVEGLPLDRLGLWLEGGATGRGGQAALGALDAALAARGLDLRLRWGGLLCDPISAMALGEVDDADAALVDLGRQIHAQGPGGPVRALASSLPYAEAGADPGWELGLLLAAGACALRGLAAGGLPLGASFAALQLQMGVGLDQVVEIAKLRAARRLWAKLGLALGLGPAESRVDLHARQLDAALAARELHTNLLRGTLAALSAVVGGADAVSVRPFDAPLGQPSPAARRLALHTQLLLDLESHLGARDDLAGGAYSVEGLTTALARAGWGHFQAIEAQGGLPAALRSGWIQAQLGRQRAALEAEVDRRQRSFIGLSDFARLDEARPAPRPWPAAPRCASAPPPLPSGRFGAAFEALRDAADAAQGSVPGVVLACIGGPARSAARRGFAAEVLAAGGLAARVAAPDWAPPPGEGPPTAAELALLDALAAAAEGAGAVVICADEADGARLALPLTERLRAPALLLAGRPGPAEAALRAAGLTDFLYLGAPLATALRRLHAALGLGPGPSAEVR